MLETTLRNRKTVYVNAEFNLCREFPIKCVSHKIQPSPCRRLVHPIHQLEVEIIQEQLRPRPDPLHHIHLPSWQAKHAVPVALRLRPRAAHEYKPGAISILVLLLPRCPPLLIPGDPLLLPPPHHLLLTRLPIFPLPHLLSPLHRLLPVSLVALGGHTVGGRCRCRCINLDRLRRGRRGRCLRDGRGFSGGRLELLRIGLGHLLLELDRLGRSGGGSLGRRRSRGSVSLALELLHHG
uniref:Uncharacterized protein n=1 Tax=Arundo donax TaxID=35708 RepID=A0A0A9DH01_ARUDO